MRRLLVLLAAAVMLGGCLGSDPESPPRPVTPVSAVLGLERPRAGPPDAGTATGHRGGGAVAIARGERFVLRGTVQPASSEVRLLDGATREQSAIARRRGAAFAFTIEHLQPGANRHLVEATHPGGEPWRQAVRITRRAPRVAVGRRVVVPREDPSPAAEVELRLDRRRLVALAIGRDPGGMARIRVSADLRLRCAADGGTREVGLVRHEPPSQVERVRVRAGTRVPGELRRRSDLRAAARRRCAESGGALTEVEGVVWAEATNAHGRDRYSAKVPIRAQP